MKNSKKILFLGRLSFDNTPCAGEVVKNQLFLGRLTELFKDVDSINLTSLTRRLKRPVLYIKLIGYLLGGVDIIIVSTFDELAVDIIVFFNKFGKGNKVIYWVIGGGIAKRFEKKEFDINRYKNLKNIIVEDVDIENDLKKLGLIQVTTVPNFKPVIPIKATDKKRTNRFVYLARITPLKGTDIILSAVRSLNRKGVSFSIDFYGFIEKGYPFEDYIAEIPNVNYKGALSLKSEEDYEYLHTNYDVLLFPTYYPNEGFPGTIIDGYMAGLPIITTQWRYNRHIVEDKKSGWLIPVQDSEKLATLIEEIIEGKYELNKIGSYNLNLVKKYDANALLNEEFFSVIGVL